MIQERDWCGGEWPTKVTKPPKMPPKIVWAEPLHKPPEFPNTQNCLGKSSDFLFPLQPPPPPRQTPFPSHPEKLDFGPLRLRLAPFRVRVGLLGGVGVGSGRGASVREKNITNLVSS